MTARSPINVQCWRRRHVSVCIVAFKAFGSSYIHLTWHFVNNDCPLRKEQESTPYFGQNDVAKTFPAAYLCGVRSNAATFQAIGLVTGLMGLLNGSHPGC
jgi:hypothetical protein